MIVVDPCYSASFDATKQRLFCCVNNSLSSLKIAPACAGVSSGTLLSRRGRTSSKTVDRLASIP